MFADRVGAPVFGARSRLAPAQRLVVDPTRSGDRALVAELAIAALATAERHGPAGVRRDAAHLLDPGDGALAAAGS